MSINWKDQCKYCQANCSYILKNSTEEFIKTLSKLEKSSEFVYGTLKWTCHYFSLNPNTYHDNDSSEEKRS